MLAGGGGVAREQMLCQFTFPACQNATLLGDASERAPGKLVSPNGVTKVYPSATKSRVLGRILQSPENQRLV